ncbi:hypothetical protein BKA65DRAFT_501818 [Rhexocercosporidium sp. MPI-PUGE-AT-0058]|nr:hypothetical protein BKA65DRAFT_501818 [Rhexocercosporidium sp. MPI-PUGE-AT-0058]
MKEPKTKLEDTSDIYDISYDCLLLFTDCLSTSRPGHVAIETSQQRFWAWSNVLNVFAEPRMSLDTQLRLDKYPQIRHLVLLLLNVLKNNLVLGKARYFNLRRRDKYRRYRLLE